MSWRSHACFRVATRYPAQDEALRYASNVSSVILVRIPFEFIDLAGKLKANLGTARVYALGTVHNVTVIGTKHTAPVGAEGLLKEDCSALRSGGGQDVPSYKAAANQQLINNDISVYNKELLRIRRWCI